MKRCSRSSSVVTRRVLACLALRAVVTSCGDDDSSATIAATQAGLDNGEGGAAEVAAALSTLSTATTTLLTSLEGGPCG
jgi:hypothetical protein